jgi:hypothetical protein
MASGRHDALAAAGTNPASSVGDAAADTLLPPLPASSSDHAATASGAVLLSAPPTCPAETGWDGDSCVTRTCQPGSIFRAGSGCVTCMGDCDPNPWWPERAPWGNSPTPFNRKAAADGLSNLPLSACRADRPTGTGIAEITFQPNGSVFRVVIHGNDYVGTRVGECVERRIRSLRVPEFGGYPVTISRPFSLR